jgi:predicted dehydrogenase
MDKFLVVGSGSAGRRHALCIRNLYPSAQIMMVKRTTSAQPLDQLEAADIQLVSTLEAGIAHGPEFTVIASPATMHLADIERLSVVCKSYLLEKPIASCSEDGRQIHKLEAERNLKVCVGHHLRFSDTSERFHELISLAGKDNLRSLSLSYGQHLRYWRPLISGRDSVTAQKDLGGGVLRELSHEIDAITFLASRPVRVQSAKSNFDGADTDGRVETTVDAIIETPTIATNLHLDMTSEVPYRIWNAVFPNFTIRANLLEGVISTVSPDGSTELEYKSGPGERDRAEVALLSCAIEGAYSSKIGPCDVAQGVHILNTIEAIEESAVSGKSIDIAE